LNNGDQQNPHLFDTGNEYIFVMHIDCRDCAIRKNVTAESGEKVPSPLSKLFIHDWKLVSNRFTILSSVLTRLFENRVIALNIFSQEPFPFIKLKTLFFGRLRS
jgi:hypothetical protein